jgi:hypothetical protein
MNSLSFISIIKLIPKNAKDPGWFLLLDELLFSAATFFSILQSYFIFIFLFFIKFISSSKLVFFFRPQFVRLFALLKFDDPFLQVGVKVKCKFCLLS